MTNERELQNVVLSRLLDFKPRKADLRRAAIMDAVIECIASEGVHNLNSVSISKRAKMLRSHVNYYFPTQAKLVQAAVMYVVDLGQEIVVAELAQVPAAKQLEAYVNATFSWFSRFPKHGAVMGLLYYYAGIDPVYRKISQQITRMSEDRIMEMLESGKDGRSRVELRRVAAAIRQQLIGSLMVYYGNGDRADFETCRKQTQESVLYLAAGFRKKK